MSLHKSKEKVVDPENIATAGGPPALPGESDATTPMLPDDHWKQYLEAKDQKTREVHLAALIEGDVEEFTSAMLDEIEKMLPKGRWSRIYYETNFLLQSASFRDGDHYERTILDNLKRYVKVECFVLDMLRLTESAKVKLSDATLDRLYTLKARSCYRQYQHPVVGERKHSHYAEAMDAVSAIKDLSRLDGDLEHMWGRDAKGEALKRRYVCLAKQEQEKFVWAHIGYVRRLLPEAGEPNFFSKHWVGSTHAEQEKRLSLYRNLPFSLSDTIELLERREIALSEKARNDLYALEARCCFLDGNYEGMKKAALEVDANLLDPKVREAFIQFSSKDEEKVSRSLQLSKKLCLEARKLEGEIEKLESKDKEKSPAVSQTTVTKDIELKANKKSFEVSRIIIRKRKDIQQLLMEIDDPSQLSPEDLLWVGENLIKSAEGYVKGCECLNLAKEIPVVQQKAQEKLNELNKKKESNAFYRGLVKFAETLKDEKTIQGKLNDIQDALKSEEGFEGYLKSSSSKFSPSDIVALAAHLGLSPAIKSQAQDLNNALQARISWRKHEETTADKKEQDRYYVEMIDAGLAVKDKSLLGTAVNNQLVQYAADPALKARYLDAMGSAKNLMLRFVQMGDYFESDEVDEVIEIITLPSQAAEEDPETSAREALRQKYLHDAKADPEKFVEEQLEEIEKLLPGRAGVELTVEEQESPSNWRSGNETGYLKAVYQEQHSALNEYLARPVSLEDLMELVESKDNKISKETKTHLYVLQARSCFRQYCLKQEKSEQEKVYQALKHVASKVEDWNLFDPDIVVTLVGHREMRNGLQAWRLLKRAIETDATVQRLIAPFEVTSLVVDYLNELQKHLPASLKSPEEREKWERYKATYGAISPMGDIGCDGRGWRSGMNEHFISGARELEAQIAWFRYLEAPAEIKDGFWKRVHENLWRVKMTTLPHSRPSGLGHSNNYICWRHWEAVSNWDQIKQTAKSQAGPALHDFMDAVSYLEKQLAGDLSILDPKLVEFYRQKQKEQAMKEFSMAGELNISEIKRASKKNNGGVINRPSMSGNLSMSSGGNLAIMAQLEQATWRVSVPASSSTTSKTTAVLADQKQSDKPEPVPTSSFNTPVVMFPKPVPGKPSEPPKPPAPPVEGLSLNSDDLDAVNFSREYDGQDKAGFS